jgi:hypothetical protein
MAAFTGHQRAEGQPLWETGIASSKRGYFFKGGNLPVRPRTVWYPVLPHPAVAVENSHLIPVAGLALYIQNF